MSQNHIDLIAHVKALLLAQGQRSSVVDGGERCRYRLQIEDGSTLKCAVGFLIPNKHYRTSMEDVCADDLAFAHSDLFDKILGKFKLSTKSDKTLKLLADLQNIHYHKEVSEWEKYFDLLVVEYKTVED